MVELRTGLDSGNSNKSRPSSLPLSQGKEVVKTDAIQLGNAMNEGTV